MKRIRRANCRLDLGFTPKQLGMIISDSQLTISTYN